jgi:hypothetical protein
MSIVQSIDSKKKMLKNKRQRQKYLAVWLRPAFRASPRICFDRATHARTP